ncbi:putative cytochrome P450 4ac1 [Cochliomyia hominivorax]
MWLLILVILLLIFLAAIFFRKLNKVYFILSLCKRLKTMDGGPIEEKVFVVPGKTIFGNNFDLLIMTPEIMFSHFRQINWKTRNKSYLLYFWLSPCYNITNARDAEEIFQSTTTITKHILYELLKPLLGDGLLISTDEKWHFRRKILTPAFHFNVLQSFQEMFKEESLKLLEKLQKLDKNPIDVNEIISEFSLNNVCETAMGVKLDDVEGSSDYRKIIHKIERTIVKRACQKFAILEMKTILVAILRNFKILPLTKLEDLIFEGGLVLRTRQKINVNLKEKMWFLILITIIFLIFFVKFLIKLNENYFILSLCKRIKTIDGRPLDQKVKTISGKTIFGNNFDLLNMTPEKIFNFCRQCYAAAQGKNYLLHFLYTASYNITNARDTEEIFQSTTIIAKGVMYELLIPFLGDGLLISTGEKWHLRRKMLTPAFHFNVLQSFQEIFKEESLKLLEKLQNLDNNRIDVIEIISEFTLNSVCETAMGVKLDDVQGGNDYRKIIHEIERTLFKRTCNPLLYYRIIFYLFGDYKTHMKNIKVAHDFTSKIIEKRREEYLTEQKKSQGESKENEFGIKKRYAMLDTLLAEEAKGHIDHKGICDEVNTFTFEGYDTTATCLIFAILNLSLHPEVQRKCREEIQNLGDFTDLKIFDLNKIEYLECVLKETLRLYPSVPFIARTCDVETRLNGLVIPVNSQINIHLYDIMRDPEYFTDPNTFKPERFLNDTSNKRHPFAFVPFSAGSRNCIGQKFAILEMKTILLAILKNYEILPITKLEDLTLQNGIVLRTKQKIYVKLKKI